MSLFSFFARSPGNSRDIEPPRSNAPAELIRPEAPSSASAAETCSARGFSWQRTIPSRADAGKAVIDEVLGQLKSLCWSDSDLFGVRLALEEAVVNAIKHGNRGDESKTVAIVCRITPDEFHIEITDEGQGFVPEEVPDPTDPENLEKPSGRGIVLMRNFMSRVAYNEGGNRVVMEKRRAAG